MYSIQDFISGTSEFAENSKIWVYFANRSFTKEEFEFIQSQLDHFSSKWKSHGASMNNAIMLIENQIVLVAVDESQHAVSGCGIDASVKVIKEIESKYEVSFFERNWVFYQENDVLKKMQLSEFKTFCKANQKIKVINPFFNNLKEVQTHFYSNIEDSLYRNFQKN